MYAQNWIQCVIEFHSKLSDFEIRKEYDFKEEKRDLVVSDRNLFVFLVILKLFKTVSIIRNGRFPDNFESTKVYCAFEKHPRNTFTVYR